MKFLIFGLGKTGFSALRYLQKQGHSCVVFDTRPANLILKNLENFQKEFPEVPYFLEDFSAEAWANIKFLVMSPGLNSDDPKVQKIIQEAEVRKLSFTSDIELFLTATASANHSKVIGITGSNGKSTVTALVGEMLKACGYRAKIGGNFGIPALDLLPEKGEEPVDFYVLELSSYQLELLSQPPELFVSVLLNISPNHLDRHKTLENYQTIKERIYLKGRFRVFNRAMDYFFHFAEEDSCSFGLTNNKDFGVGVFQGEEWLTQKGEGLLPVSKIRLLGRHNIENALASLSVISMIDANPDNVQKALNVLETFEGLSHRCRWVKKIRGVDWINDSKSTTCASTQAALNGFGPGVIARGGGIILIAGGQAKGATFESLSESILKYVKALVVLGQDAQQLIHDLKSATEIYPVRDLKAAIKISQDIAESKDLVLLSPACASLDMFKSYEHRGEVFEKELRDLRD
jgi:UDP-N-acetylmuramoylalanine--D-glutamate ligase